METKETGYQIPSYPMQTKRYCQMLDLKNDPQLIAEYKKRHSPEYYWKEIGEGIRAVGILNMEIYLLDNHLFMIVETPLDFEWKTAFQKLATLPRQEEWERYMSVFQDVDADASSDEKWQLMEQMFSLTKAME
ncbi:MAG TPA: L-rhamnose mutarotase [Candidatus Parabacteroides faecavium]|nr:L-rhamnose mutarotase [Candidatus Parabacteroides faecavium]